jgi:hypothetical protein
MTRPLKWETFLTGQILKNAPIIWLLIMSITRNHVKAVGPVIYVVAAVTMR